MIVVADSSPLIVLVNIGHIRVLPDLFGEVVIPPQIAAELADARRPQAVQDFICSKPAWLRVQAPASVESRYSPSLFTPACCDSVRKGAVSYVLPGAKNATFRTGS